jgi:hypothetical protein
MKDTGAEHPLQVESVSSSPLGEDRLVVRIEGRWEGRKRPHVDEAMLVVENEGRRHRFPAIPQEGKPKRLKRHESWSGSFDLPLWLGDHLEGQTSLRLGDATIALPAQSFRPPEGNDEPAKLRAEVAELRDELAAREAVQREALSEAARLRAELERLADELASLRTNPLAGSAVEQAEDLLAKARELRRMLAQSGPETEADHRASPETTPGEHGSDTS